VEREAAPSAYPSLPFSSSILRDGDWDYKLISDDTGGQSIRRDNSEGEQEAWSTAGLATVETHNAVTTTTRYFSSQGPFRGLVRSIETADHNKLLKKVTFAYDENGKLIGTSSTAGVTWRKSFQNGQFSSAIWKDSASTVAIKLLSNDSSGSVYEINKGNYQYKARVDTQGNIVSLEQIKNNGGI
jgi:YD repeat-containing protein